MLKRGIFIAVMLFFALCRAECGEAGDSTRMHFNLRMSYNSTIIYPGMSLGMEFPLKNESMQVFKGGQLKKSYNKERLLTGNLNWYHHPFFHDNLYLTAEWVMRRTKSTGFVSECSVGPGYSRTFLGGTTYKVDNTGNITVVRAAGYNYALITIGGGFGYDFSVVKHLPFSAVATMNVISMFPYNSTIYVRPVLEFGVRYKLPGEK